MRAATVTEIVHAKRDILVPNVTNVKLTTIWIIKDIACVSAIIISYLSIYEKNKTLSACECSSPGSSATTCGSPNGNCPCNTEYSGTKCDSCAPNYYMLADGTCNGKF